jgi:uncharacterized protein YhaN
MILKDLTIRGFGKFRDRHFDFSDGINVIYGSNEAGKSTIHSFLRAMFYGMERGRGRASKTDLFSHYEPWKDSQSYGGILHCEKDGHLYRIERNFIKNPKDVTVVDETAGTAVTDTRAFFDDLLSGLSETAYSNTVSIGQLKSATDSGMVNELKNYIANMNTTGNMALNITKASAYLKDQRKSFVSRQTPEAAKSYAANLTEIKQIEAGIASPEYANRLNALKEEKAETEKQLKDLQEKKESLIDKTSAGRQRLRENHFGSRDEIVSCREKAEQAYENFRHAQDKTEKKGVRIFTIVLLVLAAVFLALSAYLFIIGPQNLLSPFLPFPWKQSLDVSFLTSCAFFVVVIIFSEIAAAANWRMKKARDAFLDIVLEHADNAEEEENKDCETLLNEYRGKTGSLLTLADSVKEDEEQIKKTAAEAEQLNAAAKNAAETIEKQQKSQWELEQQLEHLSNLRDETNILKHVIDENDRLQFEIDAIDLAQETMTRLSTSIRGSFGLYLNKKASDLIKGITGGIYNSMSIDENLNVFLNTAEKLVPLEQVSSGTMDQVYLALRLAAADLMLDRQSEPFPLFFDDSFVNYDEDRLLTALKWLSETAHRQILIFTCHRREAQLLSANLIDYRLTEI